MSDIDLGVDTRERARVASGPTASRVTKSLPRGTSRRGGTRAIHLAVGFARLDAAPGPRYRLAPTMAPKRDLALEQSP
jgi:hypothetical protein